jgi:hypothetical protein
MAKTHAFTLPMLTYTAWRVGESGKSIPLNLYDPEGLEGAVEHALAQASHKDIFHVLETDETRRISKLHIYQVKQGKPVYRKLHGEVVARLVKPLIAHPVTTMEVREFVPAQHWCWTPGCDVVGIDRQTVEG